MSISLRSINNLYQFSNNTTTLTISLRAHIYITHGLDVLNTLTIGNDRVQFNAVFTNSLTITSNKETFLHDFLVVLYIFEGVFFLYYIYSNVFNILNDSTIYTNIYIDLLRTDYIVILNRI